MKGKLEEALSNIDMMYSQIVEIANKIIVVYTKETDDLIKQAYDKIERLTNDEIMNLMLKLSMKAYNLADTKERSSLKADCAEALKKEAYAVEFNKTEGSVALRENTAIINTSDEIVSNAIYDLVAGLFKSKLSEIHSVIDTLKSVLLTRMQEAKLVAMNNGNSMEEN